MCYYGTEIYRMARWYVVWRTGVEDSADTQVSRLADTFRMFVVSKVYMETHSWNFNSV